MEGDLLLISDKGDFFFFLDAFSCFRLSRCCDCCLKCGDTSPFPPGIAEGRHAATELLNSSPDLGEPKRRHC